MLRIDDIFVSIQGESTESGKPCIFIRLMGCNVKCSYCDQPQKGHKIQRMSVKNILLEISRYRNINNVCITGGEPLMQEEVYSLIYSLVEKRYNVSIETNGTIPITQDDYIRSFKYVMDVKTPSSGVTQFNNYDNIKNLHVKDEIKFVVANKEDYLFARNVILKYNPKCTILFSPVFSDEGKPLIGKELCEWICKDFDTRCYNVRVQLQIHKFLGVM